MLRAITLEAAHVFLIMVIIGFGMIHCCAYNVEATWDEWYQGYEYNLNPSEGTGWIDSIVCNKDHNKIFEK